MMMGAPAGDPRWPHGFGPGSNGVRLHYVRQGAGPAVLLLHGWPGFWYDWRRVLPALAGEADVIAPDFRGFGDSDHPRLAPAEGYTPEVLAADMVALLDHLAIGRVTVVAHDIGATVAQVLARTAPDRVGALVLLNPPYPGIGARRFEPQAQREFWYQHFHNLDLAEQLVGYNRETVRRYLAHFYQHWAGRKEALRPEEFESIVEAYGRPGAFAASIAYYRARAGARGREAAPGAVAPIAQPTHVLWGEADPVIPAAWADRLPEYFQRLTLRLLPGVGHFVPVEAPADVIETVRMALLQRS
jgi:pimeloyl-ACP methyl ester carboxylesterase